MQSKTGPASIEKTIWAHKAIYGGQISEMSIFATFVSCKTGVFAFDGVRRNRTSNNREILQL